MNRKQLFNIHFYLASFFTPFLLLMAFTGTSYLLGFKGKTKKILVKESITFTSKSNRKKEISEILLDIDKSYTYEAIKDRGAVLQTRPTTKDSYEFKLEENGLYSLYKINPNLQARIVEIHKGHGPALLTAFQKVLGACLLIIVMTGLFMSLKIKARSRSFIISSSCGFILLLTLFLL